MIDDEYRRAFDKTIDSLYNAMYMVIAAWQLAELSSSNDRHYNALLGLLTMAENMLSDSIEMHLGEWEIIKALAEKAE